MISRPYYLEWLNRWKDKDVIKVIAGMRRSGKSTLMQLYQMELQQQGVEQSQLISINFESLDEDYPLTAKDLYDYIAQRIDPRAKTYVFLDEVQRVDEFEVVVDALFVREDVDLYITGSNAHLLSGELATLLSGRYVEIKVYPFSFKEYHTAIQENVMQRGGLDHPYDFPYDLAPSLPSKEVIFNRYLLFGGLPFAATLFDEKDITEYLEGVFSTIFIKDIAQRKPRMDMASFESVAAFLADNVGNITSIKHIADTLATQNKTMSQGAVKQYIDSLLASHLLFKVERFNLKGKEYLRNLDKYYLGDLGFRFWLLGKSAGDVGKRIENVVYLELRRKYNRVAIGKQGEHEVDFVATSGDATHYYQVAQTVLNEETLLRELRPLQVIQDNHPKTLLTLDTIGTGDFSGIKHLNLLDWLLE